MSSPLAIRRAILQALADVPTGYTASMPMLLNVLKDQIRPPLERIDLIEHLAWLRDNRLAVSAEAPLEPNNPDARNWAITTAGRTSLAA